MKRIYKCSLVIVVASFCAYVFCSLDLETIKKDVAASSTEIFDARLYTKPFSESNATSWIKAVADVGTFVNLPKNSYNDPVLKDFYLQIKKANDFLIKTIQMTYKKIFRAGTLNIDLLEEQEAAFDEIQSNMLEIENNINKISHYVLPGKEEVRAALLLLASAIKNNASKAFNQIEEEMTLRQKELNEKGKAEEEAALKAEKEEEEAAELQKMQSEEKMLQEIKRRIQAIKELLQSIDQTFSVAVYKSGFEVVELDSLFDHVVKLIKTYAKENPEFAKTYDAMQDIYVSVVDNVRRIYRNIIKEAIVDTVSVNRQRAQLESLLDSVQDLQNKIARIVVDGPTDEIRAILKVIGAGLKANIMKAIEQFDSEVNRIRKALEAEKKASAAKEKTESSLLRRRMLTDEEMLDQADEEFLQEMANIKIPTKQSTSTQKVPVSSQTQKQQAPKSQMQMQQQQDQPVVTPPKRITR